MKKYFGFIGDRPKYKKKGIPTNLEISFNPDYDASLYKVIKDLLPALHARGEFLTKINVKMLLIYYIQDDTIIAIYPNFVKICYYNGMALSYSPDTFYRWFEDEEREKTNMNISRKWRYYATIFLDHSRHIDIDRELAMI